MKLRISYSIPWLILLFSSCVPNGKVTGIRYENQYLQQRNAELEEEVARLENLIFFLESEIRVANREKEN